MTTGSPILFWQKRLGLHKQPFNMLKFRTMHLDAEDRKTKLAHLNEAPWPMFKMRNDPRFTRIGRYLSHLGIDELPQFFHVLTGKMSFIGPRPLPLSEAQQLPRNWNFRYKVKPGILSEWALSPDRYLSLNHWRKLEIETLKKGSLINDIKMILRSCVFMLGVPRSFFFGKRKVRVRRSRPRVTSQSSSVTGRKRATASSYA